MKPAKNARRMMLASLLVGSTVVSSGCSGGGMSLASMNPFSKQATPSDVQQSPGVTTKLASAASGAGKQVGSVGTSVGNTAKTAWSKTTGAVAGVFKRKPTDAEKMEATDPLSLANKPEKISPDVFVANGQLWESTGDFAKAMESYTKALEAQPNHGQALTSIARLHFRQGNHKQAVENFQKAIAQTPNDAGLHNDLGLTLNKLGDSAGAVKSLQKALELAPGTSRYANNLASIKFESGDANAAFQVLATNNKPAVAHFNMAYLYFKGGQVNAARDHISQVMTFESQATADPAVQRAVERSRDMLAQINAASSPVAQAAPQATVASAGTLGGAATSKPVQQTSQSAIVPRGPIPGGVSPAGPFAPASFGVPAPTRPMPSMPSAPTSAAPSAATGAATTGTPTTGTPTIGTPTTGTPATGTATSGSTSPAVPFSLPAGFGTN